MGREAAYSLPASLRGMLDELASADTASGQRWILAVLKRHGPDVVALLWRMLGREQDVLDAYQSVVCQLAARGQRRCGRRRGAYFYRAAINAGIDLMRRRKREADHLKIYGDLRQRRAVASDSFVNVDHLRLVEQMRQAVLRLPNHLRDVLVLRDMAEMDYLRIAGILRIAPATARVYRRQAVIRLSVMLAKETRE
ncbi:MAG: sigma-70 family RNA polymerase sigma factor [Phycisphaerae bacterium]|nr:sigma-70 family RNA polymerase sigma factor [Phycisphaerae bacterium]